MPRSFFEFDDPFVLSPMVPCAFFFLLLRTLPWERTVQAMRHGESSLSNHRTWTTNSRCSPSPSCETLWVPTKEAAACPLTLRHIAPASHSGTPTPPSNKKQCREQGAHIGPRGHCYVAVALALFARFFVKAQRLTCLSCRANGHGPFKRFLEQRLKYLRDICDSAGPTSDIGVLMG